jgi:hypothetical protein
MAQIGRSGRHCVASLVSLCLCCLYGAGSDRVRWAGLDPATAFLPGSCVKRRPQFAGVHQRVQSRLVVAPGLGGQQYRKEGGAELLGVPDDR